MNSTCCDKVSYGIEGGHFVLSPSMKTAVLVFANTPGEEVQCKPMLKSPELFQGLTQITLRKVRNSGLPYYHFTEKEQHGNDFGERFAHAIAQLFAQGYGAVITVGNDTPHLRTKDIRKAAEALNAGKTVIGPSLDGGFYLLGIHKQNFDQKLFAQLPWQQAVLRRSLLQLLKGTGADSCKLTARADIDGAKDIKTVCRSIKSLPPSIRRILIHFLGRKAALHFWTAPLHTLLFNALPDNKGSPLLAQI